MNLTDAGINEIEKHADKVHDAPIMLICQILREIREVKVMLSQHGDNSGNSGYDGSGGANDSENKHG